MTPVEVAACLASFLPAEAEALWCGSEDSLNGFSAEAVRGSAIQRVLSISGPARTGKSHLLHLLSNRVGIHFSVVVRPALSSYSDNWDVLRALLCLVWEAFEQAIHKRGDVSHGTALACIRDLLLALQSMHNPQRECICVPQKLLNKISILQETIFAPLLANLVGAKARTSGSFVQLNNDDLCDLIALLHAAMRKVDPSWTTLLAVDDFDLLVRRSGADLWPQPLLQSLFRLARVDGLCVFTTVRLDTYERWSDAFHPVAKLGHVTSSELLAIYHRRLCHLGIDGDPLPPGFVASVAEDCDGRPGLFLDWLARVLHGEGSSELARLDHSDYVGRHWQAQHRAAPQHAPEITKAALEDEGWTNFSAGVRLRDQVLMEALYEDGSSTDRVRVHPLLAAYLRRNPGGQSSQPELELSPIVVPAKTVDRSPASMAELPDVTSHLSTLGLSMRDQGEKMFEAGRLDDARNTFEETLQLARRSGSPILEADVLSNLGSLSHARGGSRHDFKEAIDWYEQALLIYQSHGHSAGERRCWQRLGEIQLDEGDFDKSLASLTQALSAAEVADDLPIVAAARRALGELATVSGQPATAHLDEALKVYRNIGDSRGQGHALRAIGALALSQGKTEFALVSGQQSLALALACRDHAGAARAFLLLARVRRSQGFSRDSMAMFDEAIREAGLAGNQAVAKAALTGLGQTILKDQKC